MKFLLVFQTGNESVRCALFCGKKAMLTLNYDSAFEDFRVWTGQSFFIRVIQICQNLYFQLCVYLQASFLIVT